MPPQDPHQLAALAAAAHPTTPSAAPAAPKAASYAASSPEANKGCCSVVSSTPATALARGPLVLLPLVLPEKAIQLLELQQGRDGTAEVKGLATPLTSVTTKVGRHKARDDGSPATVPACPS